VGGDGAATVTAFNYKGAGILSPFSGLIFLVGSRKRYSGFNRKYY